MAETPETVDIFPINFNPALFGKIFTSFWSKVFNSNTFSDITLVINDSERIKAHKLVLSSTSHKFAKLIAENSSQSELKLQFSNPKDAKLFHTLIKFVYTGNVNGIETPDIVPLLSLAFEYQVTSLLESCGEALESSITDDNVFYFLEVANKFSSHSLMKSCGKYLGENFSTLRDIGALQPLSVDSWVGILQNDTIKCKGELDLFNSVIDFCRQFKGQERTLALEKLLPHIRYGMLSAQALFEKVECNEYVKDIKSIKDLVFIAYRERVTGKSTVNRRKYGTGSWCFAPHPQYGVGNALQISEDGLTLTKPNVSQHAMALGNVELEPNLVHYWEITIKQFTSGINIGVVSLDHISGMLNNYVGSVANTFDYCNTGTKISAGQSVGYGQQYSASDVIGVMADLINYQLTYFRNGQNLGVAYTLPKNTKLAPAVSLYSNSCVTLEVKEAPVV